MDEEGSRLEGEQWGSPNFEQDEQELKLISLIAERDAAILERNTAFSEKKAVCAERDAALLQRDVAYAERNTAIMERDAALAALHYVKNASLNGGRTDVGAKIVQVLAQNPFAPFVLREDDHPQHQQNVQPIAMNSTNPGILNPEPQKQSKKQKKRKTDKSELPRKQRKNVDAIEDVGDDAQRTPLAVVKHEWRDSDDVEDDNDGDGSSGLTIDTSAMPIPACSCTGMLQQCYRWGNGGWQSACCTTNLSMYPLPMNAKKKGARVPGRKMSGGAFRKLLRRLLHQGYNLSQPIDLKHHWAKHGTNRYVTIK